MKVFIAIESPTFAKILPKASSPCNVTLFQLVLLSQQKLWKYKCVLNPMACVLLRFIDDLIHCRALFSENLPCTSLHLQRAGTGRIITSIESLHQMFQEWRNSIFGWLASGGRKTARGSACVWAGMCHASPWLVSASPLCCWQPSCRALCLGLLPQTGQSQTRNAGGRLRC